ncbi:hypothetical protein PVAP13_1NG202357 [Panicum virgatum]|uniref:CCHC-type domain-containing protein n=1 Tax=Panicum virgatum TaxID=38727 RepID=A0A8T0WSA2_PANVG|nr:hypothetical protein PVAP13_1NG202357 [Panicum virgatum]
MHTIKETDRLIAMMDLLLKKIDEGNKLMFVPVHAMSLHSMCEVCGDGGHSGNDCPETREEAAYINNNNNRFRPQGGQGWCQGHPPFQGGDSTIRHPEGIVENIYVRIKKCFVLADFIVLDMEGDLGMDLILG